MVNTIFFLAVSNDGASLVCSMGICPRGLCPRGPLHIKVSYRPVFKPPVSKNSVVYCPK